MRRGENTLTAEELLVSSHLRAMRLSKMAEAFEKQMLDPNADLSPFMDRFSRIISEEWPSLTRSSISSSGRQSCGIPLRIWTEQSMIRIIFWIRQQSTP